MDACPVCRAKLNGETTCRRCRADLRKVQEVEQRGQVLAVAAMLALAAGDAADAMRWTERAHAVHASPAVRALHALVSAALRSDERAPQSGVTTREASHLGGGDHVTIGTNGGSCPCPASAR